MPASPYLLISGWVALLGLTITAAYGQSTVITDQLTVRAEVAASCSLDGGTLDFGTYTAEQTAPLKASTTIGYRCPERLSIRIELDPGRNPSNGNRAMALDGDGGEVLGYELYQDAAHKVPWGGAGHPGEPLEIASTRSQERIDVHGAIFPGQSPAPGTYGDVVRINLIIQ